MDGPLYQRQEEIDLENSGDSLALIARHITPGSEVLELGVATGYFSRFLNEKRQCTVDGVEVDPGMAEQAAPWCRRLVVADLERERLADHLPPAAYDYVVCADVLEHLADPDAVLGQLSGMLKAGGRVIASIPNVAYAGLLLSLIEGDLDYRDVGLLDKTHRRFYTRKSSIDLFSRLGFRVEATEPVLLELEASELFEKLNHAVVPLKDYFCSRPEALAYQYVIVAAPAGAAEPGAGAP